MYGLQRLGDNHIAVNGDGQEVYHGGDAKQGAAERIHLTAYKQKEINGLAAASTTAGY